MKYTSSSFGGITILLDQCKGDCNTCPIEYIVNSHKREVCMCRCHPHASVSSEEWKQQEIGLGKLVDLDSKPKRLKTKLPIKQEGIN
jgi:hypothetical protein